jgi:hypothetical protein
MGKGRKTTIQKMKLRKAQRKKKEKIKLAKKKQA